MTDKGNERDEEKRYQTRLDYFEDELGQLKKTCETYNKSKLVSYAKSWEYMTEDQFDHGKAFCEAGETYFNAMI